jgi:hypothetical protein
LAFSIGFCETPGECEPMVPILARWGAMAGDEEDLKGEVGGLWERFDQQMQKMGCTK